MVDKINPMKIKLFALTLFIAFNFAKAQTPYTAKVTATNGTLLNSYKARICPPSGFATLKASAAWPFGAGYQTIKYLYISNGNTYHISCGVTADYDSIRIDSGGTLIIDDYSVASPSAWTVIGCKGTFVLNGTILAVNGAHHGGSFPLFEPDSIGNRTIPSLTYSITKKNAGNGGAGGNSHQINNGPCFGSGGAVGLAYNGNGGGGGGGSMSCNGNPQYGCYAGYTGSNANDTMSGSGGEDGGVNYTATLPTPGVSVYGQNGNLGLTRTWQHSCNCCMWSSSGGSGGSRGKHGGLLYIKAMKSITGTGTINVGGQKGGDGGASDYAQFVNGSYYSGCGGGGGGAAGGSGGYADINYAGVAPTVSVITNYGAAGAGGIAYNGTGANGVNGDSGLVGQKSIQPLLNGYTYQWFKNFAIMAGRTKDTLNANSLGLYNCKITNTQNIIRTTNYDTVLTDSPPIATITNSVDSICAGSTATFIAQNIVGQHYQWYNNSLPTAIGDTLTSFNVSSGGNYQVLVSNSCNNSPGVFSSNVPVTINPNPITPVITPSGPTTFCQGASVNLTSNYSNNNTWSTGATTTSISVNQVGTNTITVTYKNSHNCTATSLPEIVTVKPASVNAGPDTALVCGQGLQLNPVINPTSTVSVNWTPVTYLSNASILTPVCTPVNPTTYTLNVSFSNGCSATDVLNIVNNPISNFEICMVAVDTSGISHNVIYWDKTAFANVDTFIIQRELTLNSYVDLYKVPYTALSEYHDLSANPTLQTYRYKMGVIDTCGARYDTITPYHNTIFIQQLNNQFTIQTQYQIEGQSNFVLYYVLERDSLSNGIWDSIASTRGLKLFSVTQTGQINNTQDGG